jgi:thioredoxin-related protein
MVVFNMKIARSLIASLLLVGFGLSPAPASDEWQTDYKAALAEASKENKMVLLDFTGSDWCGWCIKLVKDTFSQPEFQKFADKHLVLVELDFPNGKPQSPEVKLQNHQLSEKFGVEGFPTLVLLDSKGKEVARNVGYLAGGPEAFIKWVEAAKKK